MDPVSDFIVFDFAAVAAAVLILIAFFATITIGWILGTALATVIEQVPGVGGGAATVIRNAVNGMARGIYSWAGSLEQSATAAGNALFDAYASKSRSAAFNTRQVQAASVQAIAWLASSVSPANQQAQEQWIGLAVSGLQTVLENEIVTSYDNATGYTQSFGTAIEQWAQSQLTEVRQEVGGVAQSLSQTANSLLDTIDSDYNRAISYAQDTYTAATTYAEQAADSVLTTARNELADDYNTLRGYTTDVQTWAQGAITDANQHAETLTDGLQLTIASTLGVAVAEIADTVEKCLTPMCENGPDFMSGLGGLLDVAGLAGLFALVAEAVANPERMGSDLAPGAHAVIADAADLLHTLARIG